MECSGVAGDAEDVCILGEELLAEGFSDAAGGSGDEEGFTF